MHYNHYDLTGLAFNPVNSAWGPIGPFELTFDATGGQYTSLTGQVINQSVTNITLTINGSQYLIATTGNGDVYLSAADSGLAIHSPNQTFTWQFNGLTFAPGDGYFQTESWAYSLQISNVTVTAHIDAGVQIAVPIVPEPQAVRHWHINHAREMALNPLIMALACSIFVMGWRKLCRISTR